MFDARLKKGKRPDVVTELEGLDVSVLLDPRPFLDGFDVEAAMRDLPSEKRALARAACEKAGVPDNSLDAVLRVLCELIEYQRLGAAGRTVKDDLEDFRSALQMARDLTAKIERLPENLKLALMVACQQVVDETWPEEWQLRYEDGCGLVTPLVLLGDGAERALQAFNGSGASGKGRKPVLDHHGWHILDIWEVVESAGLTPGRGEFLHLCDALFEAAGIPSKAEGAVRYFKDNLSNVLPLSADATLRLFDRIHPDSADSLDGKKARKNPARKRPK